MINLVRCGLFWILYGGFRFVDWLLPNIKAKTEILIKIMEIQKKIMPGLP